MSVADRERPSPHSTFRYMRRGFLFWIALVMVPVGTIFSGITWHMAGLESRYDADGKAALGVVTDKESVVSTDGDGRRSTTYYLSYRFTPYLGAEQEGRDSVGRARYEAAAIGDDLRVEYLETEPGTHRIAKGSKWTEIWVLGAVGGTVLGIGVVLGWLSLRAASRLRRILLNGVPIKARLTGVERTAVRVNGRNRYRLEWQYLGPQNRMQTGRSLGRRRSDFIGHIPGDAIDILVDPDDPSRSAWAGDATL